MATSRAIVLMAFGKNEYAFMAAHLAMSIKHHDPEMEIHLIADETRNYISAPYLKFFNAITPIKKEHVYRDGKFDPGWAKVNVYPYLKHDENIYLDVDALVINPIGDVFDMCPSFYHTEVTGTGGINDNINYSFWASNKDIWSHFKLGAQQKYSAVQSSFQFYRKSKEAEELHKRMVENYDFPKEKLSNQWGGTMPDELIIAGSCAQMNHNPMVNDNRKIVYFGHSGNRKDISDVQDNFWVLSLYGNGNGNRLVGLRYIEYYDRLMFKYGRLNGVRPILRAFQLMKKKHAG